MPEFPIDVAAFVEAVGDPPNTANQGKVYAKDVAGVTQLFYEDDAGVVYQLTPPSAGSSQTFDLVYDSGAVASGNVYSSFAALYADAILLNGTRRVYLNTDLVLDAVYALDGQWEFVGVSDNSINRIYGNVLISDDGTGATYFEVNGGPLYLKNLSTQSIGNTLFRAQVSATNTTIFFKCDNVQLETAGAAMWDTFGADLIADLTDSRCTSDGANNVFGNIAVTCVCRNSDISDTNTFSGDLGVVLYFESGLLPPIPTRGGFGGSPWNSGANPANYQAALSHRVERINIQTTGAAGATFNDADIWGLSWADLVRVNALAAGQFLTGFLTSTGSGGVEEQRVKFYLANVGANAITLRHDNAGSTAQYRFLISTGADYVLPVNGMVAFVYDEDSLRWRVMV